MGAVLDVMGENKIFISALRKLFTLLEIGAGPRPNPRLKHYSWVRHQSLSSRKLCGYLAVRDIDLAAFSPESDDLLVIIED